MKLSRIHQNSKLLIVNPYVVRVNHGGDGYNLDYKEFRKMLSLCKNIATSSWGYSNPETEIKHEETTNVTSIFAGIQQQLIYAPMTATMISYWAFSSEEDALQFRLTLGDSAKRCHMWPSDRPFTIYEME